MTLPQHEYAKNWVVLLVDDEEDNLYMAQLTLEYWGAEVHVGKNGKHGMKLLEEVDPTVILLDLSMPEMDGWAMHDKVREQEKYSVVPIIALTAHAMANDKSKVMAAGFDGYITKPFMIDSFMEYIKECVERRQQLYASKEHGVPDATKLSESSPRTETEEESVSPPLATSVPETEVEESMSPALATSMPETEVNQGSIQENGNVEQNPPSSEMEKEENSQ